MEESKSFYVNLFQLKCSIITGIAKVFIVQPFDFIRFRIQSSHDHPVKLLNLLKTISDKEGIKLFLKGSNATATGVFISSLVQFSFYQRAYTYLMTKRFKSTNIHKILNLEGSYLTLYDKDKIIKKIALTCGLAGFCSGVALAIFTTPVDNIRIKLQARQNLITIDNKSFYKNNTTVECIQNIYKDQGVKGFYLAFPAAFVRETIASTIYFSVFEFFKNREKIRYNKDNIKISNSFIYGALAGAVNWVVTFPVDIVKTKIISDTISGERRYSGILDCIKKLYSQHGVFGFYTGFSVVLLRSLVVNGVVLTSFEICRSKL